MTKLLGYILLSVSLIYGLSGCVTAKHSVSIACFADEEARKARRGVTGEFPIVISNGVVLFYDEDGALHRVKDAVCGLKGGEE